MHETASAPPPKAGSRRVRFGLSSAAIVLAVAVIAAMLNILASRLAPRFDVTATGDQKLAPRTLKLLGSLKGEHEIVVAAPLSQIDRQTRARVLDVLGEFEHANAGVRRTLIDTATPGGVESFAALVRRLADRDKDVIAGQRQTVEQTRAGAGVIAGVLHDTLSPALLALKERVPPGVPPNVDAAHRARQALDQHAALARVAARDVLAASASAGDLLKAQVHGVTVPQIDEASRKLTRPLQGVVEQLGQLAKDAGALAESKDFAALGEDARAIRREAEMARDRAALLLEPLSRLKRLDLLRVSDALRAGTAVLVVGPPEAGLTAVDSEAVFPSREWLEAANRSNADLGRRVEDLFATALSSLSGPPRPIVVAVHAEPKAMLDQSGLFTQLRQRLEMQGMDLVEWACVVQPEPLFPASSTARPVVYASLPPDSSAGAGGGEMTGVQRAARLGEVLTRLVDEGQSVLLSMGPSVSPTYGEVDATVTTLSRFGLAAGTGKPLMSEQFVSGGGRVVQTEQILLPVAGEHPLQKAVSGLPTLLFWPIALENTAEAPKVKITRADLLTMRVGDGLWAESQWLSWWQRKADERQMSRDQPQFDSGRDLRNPAGAPGAPPPTVWTVATALERSTGEKPQRLVAVGSNGWFTDRATMSAAMIDGRVLPRTPGNLELFEACVRWLSFQDDLIAQSPAGRILPVVMDLSPGRASVLRWSLALGLPLVVLALGLAYRVIRG